MNHTSGPLHMLFSPFGMLFLRFTCLSRVTAYLWFWFSATLHILPAPDHPWLAWSIMHFHDALHLSFQPYSMSFLSSGLWVPRGGGCVCTGQCCVQGVAGGKSWITFWLQSEQINTYSRHLKRCLHNQQLYARLPFKWDKLKVEL